MDARYCSAKQRKNEVLTQAGFYDACHRFAIGGTRQLRRNRTHYPAHVLHASCAQISDD